MVIEYKGVCLRLKQSFSSKTKDIDDSTISALENRYEVKKWLPKTVWQDSYKLDNIYKYMCIEDVELGSGMDLYAVVDSGSGGLYGKNIPFFFPSLRKQLSYFIDIKSKKALDFGSGWGLTTWKLLLNGFNVTALDIAYNTDKVVKTFSRYVFSRAPEQFKNNLEIKHDNFLNFFDNNPALKASYDLINIQYVFHFYPPHIVTKMIKDAFLLLKEGGKLVVATESIEAGSIMCRDKSECEEKFCIIKSEYKPPYIFQYVDNLKSGLLNFTFLDKYEDSEYTFKQDGNVIHSLKTFFDFESLSQVLQDNGFKVIDSFHQDDTVINIHEHFVSLAAEKVIDIDEI